VSLSYAKPSLQGTFSLVYSGDPALKPRPELKKDADGNDIPDPEIAKAQAEWDAVLKRCEERGDWKELTIDGDNPTVFSFKLPKSAVERDAMLERLQTRSYGSRTLSMTETFSLAFRSLVTGVSNLQDVEVKFIHDRELDRKIATPEISDVLLAIGHAQGAANDILVELAVKAIERLSVSGKS